jgi:hypothetical protein
MTATMTATMPTTMPTTITATMPSHLQPLADHFNRVVDAVMAQGNTVTIMLAAGVGLVGLALLLWGRIVHRAALVLIAFPMGMGLGAILADRVELNVWLGVFAVAVTLTILVIVLARVVWALLAGLWLAVFAAAVTGWFMLGDLTPSAQPGWNPTMESLIRSAWDVGSLQITAAGVGSGVAGLILGLFLPRATVIAVTSMLGATILGVAALKLTGMAAPGALAGMQANPPLTTGIFAGVLLLGILYQSVREVRAKRAEAEAKAKADADDGPRDIHKPPTPKKG